MSTDAKTALVVEDDAIWSGIYRSKTRSLGYKNTQTDNLQEAVRLIESQEFDLYIIDGQFPNESRGTPTSNGLTFCRRIAERYPSKKGRVMLITADEETVESARREGIEAYSKPMEVETALDSLR